MHFIIPGVPMGKARARTVRNRATGRVVSYTPEKTAAYENMVRLAYHAQCPNGWMGDKAPLRAEILAWYPVPASASRKAKAAMTAGQTRPTKKPDCDNIAKIILDALNGVAYRDDAQIVELRTAKYYSEQPRVEVKLEALDD